MPYPHSSPNAFNLNVMLLFLSILYFWSPNIYQSVGAIRFREAAAKKQRRAKTLQMSDSSPASLGSRSDKQNSSAKPLQEAASLSRPGTRLAQNGQRQDLTGVEAAERFPLGLYASIALA